MATAHVVVIDTTARRATVKTAPNTHLSDVLEEACKKLGLKASNYGLKNNNKQVDLSRTFRLSGLSSGAKLELVQLSKSAGVVSVALQIPQAEAAGIPNGRLTDKFPSDTTLWQVLRKFEDGVAGGQSSQKNLTRRGVPSTNEGAGRLYYEQPVLQIMNRELASLADLNKTLAQLGVNTGSVLIRLSFRASETPLEEAATQIAQYFMAVDHGNQPSQAQPAPTVPKEEEHKPPEPEKPEWMQDSEPENTTLPEAEPMDTTASDNPTQSDDRPSESTLTPTKSRPLSVYRPSSSSTPSAALTTHNEADYTPTIEHAQVHQKMLAESTRNKRLPTEAEIAAAAEAEQEKLAAIKDVELKIRFPDQLSITATFTRVDTGNSLYTEVKERMLDSRFKDEPFVLRDPSTRSKGDILVIPNNDKKLIQQLGLKGRVMLVFGWADNASVAARGAKSPLKEEVRASAVELTVKDVPITNDDGDNGIRVNLGKQEDKKEEGGGIGKKMPKWLKLGGKK